MIYQEARVLSYSFRNKTNIDVCFQKMLSWYSNISFNKNNMFSGLFANSGTKPKAKEQKFAYALNSMCFPAKVASENQTPTSQSQIFTSLWLVGYRRLVSSPTQVVKSSVANNNSFQM